MASGTPSYTVYVIELNADALAEKDRIDLRKGALYVGHTSLSPEERLAKHQAAGDRAAKVFKRMKDPTASTLRPDLATYAGPYATRAEAMRNERKMHNRLDSDGYRVFGDKGSRLFRALRKGAKP